MLGINLCLRARRKIICERRDKVFWGKNIVLKYLTSFF